MGSCLVSSNSFETNDHVNRIFLIGNNENNELTYDLEKHDKDINDITDIVSGFGYTVYCNHDTQKYYVSGKNDCGQCGIESIETKSIPFTPITYFNKNNIMIKRVFTNPVSLCTFWITNDNKVYANGDNKNGKLSVSDTKYKYISEPFLVLKNIVDIKSNNNHSVALWRISTDIIINGYLKVYIYNNWIPNDIIFIMAEFYGVHSQSKVYRTISGSDRYAFVRVDALDDMNIIKIDCQFDEFYCLQSNGNVLRCKNWNKIIFTPQQIKYFVNNKIKIKDISCGSNNSLAVDFDGKLYSWTDYENIKRVESLKDYKIIKIQCGHTHSYAMSDDNKHFLWGSNKHQECIYNDDIEINIEALKPLNIEDNIIKHISLGFKNTKIIFEHSIDRESLIQQNQ